ncbi:MAG TPA: hypothetical protein VFV52_13310, partial [Bacilli bacterium]|nr:hypothetical protein [Bacilli bacterium]
VGVSPMHEAFIFDKRLGVYVLRDDFNAAKYTPEECSRIFSQWSLLCASMTNRVSEIEAKINELLEQMYIVKTDDEMHEINYRMSELASVICDLNILSRAIHPEMFKVHF